MNPATCVNLHKTGFKKLDLSLTTLDKRPRDELFQEICLYQKLLRIKLTHYFPDIMCFDLHC